MPVYLVPILIYCAMCFLLVRRSLPVLEAEGDRVPGSRMAFMSLCRVDVPGPL